MTRDKEAAIKVKVKLDTITPGDAIAKQQCHGCKGKIEDDGSQCTPLFDTNKAFKTIRSDSIMKQRFVYIDSFVAARHNIKIDHHKLILQKSYTLFYKHKH